VVIAYVRGVIPANGFIFRPVEGEPNKTLMTRISAVWCERGKEIGIELGEKRGEERKRGKSEKEIKRIWRLIYVFRLTPRDLFHCGLLIW